MTDTIKSGIAMVKVLEAWDIDHIFGIPGGSINTIMDALHSEQSNIKYIQVRHEEVGALAAVGETKMSGKIGVAFATAGPVKRISSKVFMMPKWITCQCLR